MLQHPGVLAPYRAVDDGSAGSLRDRSRGPNGDRTIDNRQRGLETLDIAGGLADKILDREWIADMKDIDVLDPSVRGRDIYSHGLVMFGDELKEGLADLS